MKKYKSARSALTATLLASAVSVSAFAQIEEIIITAEKRESNVQDTAIAISAFSDGMMDDLGIAGATDIANFTPGMSFNNGTYSNRINIRGIGRLTNELGSDPGVAIYEDGFYTSESGAMGAPPMNVLRYEVLRGPQGTLYGRNAMGGAVNIISKRPTEEFEGEARFNFGNIGAASGAVSLSGPLTEKIGYRVLFNRTIRDGFVKNLSGEDLGNLDDSYIQAQLNFAITDRTNLWIKYGSSSWNRRSGPAWPGLTLDPFDQTGATFGGVTPGQPFYYGTLNPNPWLDGDVNPTAKDLHTVDYDYDGYLTLDDHYNLVTELTHDFGAMTFKYIGGWSAYDWQTSTDWDQTSDPDEQYFVYIQEDKKWSSHDFQLASNDNESINWLIGYYMFEEEIYQPFHQMDPYNEVIRHPIQGLDPITFLPIQPLTNPDGTVYLQEGDLESEAWAIYGQVDFQVNDQLHLSGGLRYSHDEKTGIEHSEWAWQDLPRFDNPDFGLPGEPEFLSEFGTYCWGDPVALTDPWTGQCTYFADNGIVTQSESWDATTFRIEADYDVNENVMVYAHVGTGYKSGGFKLGNLFSVLSDPDGAGPLPGLPEDIVDAEKVVAYEVGYKGILNDVLRLNLAAYLYDYTDFQVPISVFAEIYHTIFINAQEAESYGFEAEALWQATDNLSFIAVYSNQNTEITKMDPQEDALGVGGPALKPVVGNELLMSPNHTFTVNAMYEWDRDSGHYSVSATHAYVGDQFMDLFNSANTTIKSSNRTDLRASWENPEGDIRLIGYVKNATDEDIIGDLTQTNWEHGNQQIGAPQLPRTYGLELHFKF